MPKNNGTTRTLKHSERARQRCMASLTKAMTLSSIEGVLQWTIGKLMDLAGWMQRRRRARTARLPERPGDEQHW